MASENRDIALMVCWGVPEQPGALSGASPSAPLGTVQAAAFVEHFSCTR